MRFLITFGITICVIAWAFYLIGVFDPTRTALNLLFGITAFTAAIALQRWDR